MKVWEALFMAALLGAAVPFVIYPMFLGIFSRLLRRPWKAAEDAKPEVTIVIPAFNERAVIADKIRNTLSLDYPADKVSVLVISDGSTDGTVREANGAAGENVEVVALEENRGKPAVINLALEKADTDVVVVTDASSLLEPGSLAALVKPFADESVGATCGMLVPAGSEGIEAYRSFENNLRRAESMRNSSIGATGALYAFRKSLAGKLREDTILDDVVLPMKIVGKKKRLIFTPDARTREREAASHGREFRRKARTLGGNWQAFFMLKRLFVPGSGVVLGLLGHRVFRVASPFFLALALAANIVLCFYTNAWYYNAALGAQAALYGTALAGGLLDLRGPAGWPWTFLLLEAAAAWGFMLFITGRLVSEWRRTAETRTLRS